MSKLLNVYIHDDNQADLNKVDNKAKLINDLLREHFRKLDPNKMTPEEIRKEVAKRKAWAQYQKEIDKLK